MSPQTKIELCAFDIAGTTINDRHLVYSALENCLTEDGVEVDPEHLSRAMGVRKDHAIKMLLEKAGLVADDAVVQRYFQKFTALLNEYYAKTPPVGIEGAAEAIAELRKNGVKVALTTGFSQDIARLVLQSAGWTVGETAEDTVDVLVTSDEVPAGRPAPYLIYRAMERTGVTNIKSVLAAGDTIADLGAGMNAGAAVVVGVLTGPTPAAKLQEKPHTHILKSVAEIPALVAEYNAQ